MSLQSATNALGFGIEHQSNGVDSRWAACDLHNPESE